MPPVRRRLSVVPGDIAQAHTPNEWIDKREIDKCMAFLRQIGGLG